MVGWRELESRMERKAVDAASIEWVVVVQRCVRRCVRVCLSVRACVVHEVPAKYDITELPPASLASCADVVPCEGAKGTQTPELWLQVQAHPRPPGQAVAAYASLLLHYAVWTRGSS